MTSRALLDGDLPPVSFFSLCWRPALHQGLFLANAVGTLIALATLEVMVAGAEHATYLETAFSIESMEPFPHAVAQFGP